MAIVPKRKTSKQRKRLRKSQDKIQFIATVKCNNCDRFKQSHTVCFYCGFYKNKKVHGFNAQDDKYLK